MRDEFVPAVVPPDSQDPDAWWFAYSGYRLLVKVLGDAVEIPVTGEAETRGVDLSEGIYLGKLRGRPCYAAEGEIPERASSELVFRELRSLYGRLEDEIYEIALFGVHLAGWDQSCRFCSQCRGKLKSRRDMRAKECEACGRLEFPRISPAIIVLVEKDNAILLARSPRFAGRFFSVLAGFVEPGESLEEAVRREVKEETGISVKDIEYFGSQPWPFPDSLMIGFTARYDSGEIRIDGEEIVDAGWYRADNLPQLPGKLSIARRLIDSFISKHS